MKFKEFIDQYATAIEAVVIGLLLVGIVDTCAAQTVHEGNVYRKVKKSTRSVRDTLITDQWYEGPYGKLYPVILNKNTGHCYIIVTSKNGKQRREHTDSTVCLDMCTKYNVTYIPPKRKK